MVSTEGRCQRVDLEALELKVLLLGGAPGVVLLGTPELQYTKCSVPHPPVKDFFQIIFT